MEGLDGSAARVLRRWRGGGGGDEWEWRRRRASREMGGRKGEARNLALGISGWKPTGPGGPFFTWKKVLTAP